MTPFEKWWHSKGKNMRPFKKEDAEKYIQRLCYIAWVNGEYTTSKRIKEQNENN